MISIEELSEAKFDEDNLQKLELVISLEETISSCEVVLPRIFVWTIFHYCFLKPGTFLFSDLDLQLIDDVDAHHMFWCLMELPRKNIFLLIAAQILQEQDFKVG